MDFDARTCALEKGIPTLLLEALKCIRGPVLIPLCLCATSKSTTATLPVMGYFFFFVISILCSPLKLICLLRRLSFFFNGFVPPR